MLTRITFRDYKRFDKFVLNCQRANILVGPNNSGKSSLLDAFRILFGALRFAKRFRPRLTTTFAGEAWGYEIPDGSIPIATSSVVRNFGDEGASIEFRHANGRDLVIELDPTRATRFYLSGTAKNTHSAKAYFAQFPIDLIVVPTLSPIELEEKGVAPETLERNRTGRLSSRSFRQIWSRSDDGEFRELAALVQETWNGIAIFKPEFQMATQSYAMFYREDRVDKEISSSGFGFQVWLQILTHALRGSAETIFILDEPDIYLHPDLQHRLLDFIGRRFNQYFVATHSSEIINAVPPGDIVLVSAKFRHAKRIRSESDYNDVFSAIGSIENIDLARLSRSKRVIFYEGKDKAIVNKFIRRIDAKQIGIDSNAVVVSVGGFGQWHRVVSAAWTFKNVLGIDIGVLAVFDRDYRDKREVADVVGKVSANDVRCIIWERKEIENYALCSRSVAEVLVRRVSERAGASPLGYDEALAMIDRVSDVYRHDVTGQLTSESHSYELKCRSGVALATVSAKVGADVAGMWDSLDERLKIIPGKKFISDLSEVLAEEHAGATLTLTMLIDEVRRSELDAEFVESLREISEFANEE